MIRATAYPLNTLEPLIVTDLLAAARADVAQQLAVWEERTLRLYSAALDSSGKFPMLPDFAPVHKGFLSGVHFIWVQPDTVIIIRSEIVGHFDVFPVRPDMCDGSKPVSREAGHMGYAVLPTWLFVEPGDPRTFADQFSEFE